MMDTDNKSSYEQNAPDPQAELVRLVSFTRGVFHNIGNIVNTLCISAETAVEIVEHIEYQGVGEAAKLLRSLDDELAENFDEEHPLRLLPSYLEDLSLRLSEQQNKAHAELQVLIESAEHIRENLQYQHALLKDDLDDAPVDIGHLIEHVLSLHQNMLKREHIHVAVSCEPIPPTRLKRRPLLQVLTNLIVNSKHAMQECQRERLLRITVASDEERILVRVTDNGMGIEQSDLTRIFDHGFTTKEQGLGIGLSISRQLIEQLGGSLSAESAGPGEGATFVVSLPLND